MTVDPSAASAHFVRAVSYLGARRPVVVRTPVFNANGVKILDQGVRIDEHLYERLSSHTLARPLDDCIGSEPSVTAERLAEAAAALCRQEALFARMAGEGRQREQMFDEIALVPMPDAIAFQLTVMRETRPEAWMHALRSTVAAAWLGARLGGNRYDMRHLAAAGAVHDLGLLHLDPVLDRPDQVLGREQRRQLYLHPVLSRAQLERHHEYPREVLGAVLEHHEALDGSGYPRHLSGASISPWGRVLAMTELVVGMFSGARPHAAQRLSLALRLNRHRYDAPATEEVIALLRRLGGEPLPAPARDPVQALAAIEALLQRWPGTAPAGLSPARQQAVAEIQRQAAQVQRNLAAAGGSQAQLVLMGPDAMDDTLRVELDLLVDEIAWQLRAVGRQARRRWRRVADEALPGWLERWLAEADALCEGRGG